MNKTFFEPFHSPLFRSMWIAISVSNIGTWMNEIGAVWLMSNLSSSDLMIALIQTASTLPFFLLAYMGGTLADIVNRRNLLLFIHVWLVAVAVTLALFSYFELLTDWSLLLLTFCLGAGNALMRPAWAASVPGFVERKQLREAVTLNSMSTNVSRAIGPALAGYIIFLAGVKVIFLINILTFMFMLFTLYRWQLSSDDKTSSLPVERFFSATIAGFRYTSNVPALKVVIIRSLFFFFFACCAWSLLPVVIIKNFDATSHAYGLLMAIIGAGSISGAFIMPALHQHLSRDQIITAISGLLSLTLFLLSIAQSILFLCIPLFLIGFCWIIVFSSFVVAAQLAVPDWVRARSLAIVMLTLGGTSAIGSALWGYLSDLLGTSIAIQLASAGLLSTLLLALKFKIEDDNNLDHSPSLFWPAQELPVDISLNQGPVMVQISYRPDDHELDTFFRLIKQMKNIRKKNGAFFWEMFHQSSEPNIYIETYMINSWVEYLRQQERHTATDIRLQEGLFKINKNNQQPKINVLVAGRSFSNSK